MVRIGSKPTWRAAACIQFAREGTNRRTRAPSAARIRSTAAATSNPACVGWRSATSSASLAGIAPSGAGSARTATTPTRRLSISRTRMSVAHAPIDQPPRDQLAGSSTALDDSQTACMASASAGSAARNLATPVLPGVQVKLSNSEASSVHRQQRLGDQLDLDAVWVFEVDRCAHAAVRAQVRCAAGFEFGLDSLEIFRGRRDRNVLHAPKTLNTRLQAESGKVEECQQVVVADVKKQVSRALVVSVFH